MKKFIGGLLLALVTALCVFSIAACGGGNSSGGGNQSGTEQSGGNSGDNSGGNSGGNTQVVQVAGKVYRIINWTQTYDDEYPESMKASASDIAGMREMYVGTYLGFDTAGRYYMTSDGDYLEQYGSFTQSGNTVSVTETYGDTATGTVSGNSFTLVYTYTESYGNCYQTFTCSYSKAFSSSMIG